MALCAAVVGIAFGAQGAGADDLYLAPTGTDAGDCLNQAAPCRGINYVQSQAGLTPGADTVHLAAGVYDQDTAVLVTSDITWAGPQAGVPAREQTGPTATIEVLATGGIRVWGAGNVFDGLTFQSQDYAAADAPEALYNKKPLVVRNSVFTHVLTGISTAADLTVEGVDFDMVDEGLHVTNTTTVSDTRFNPAGGGRGLASFNPHGAITITGSTFTGDAYGVQLGAGADPVTIIGSSFSPSLSDALNNDGRPVDASDNWWGCNDGANGAGCATRTGAGATTTEPHLVLRALVDPDPVPAGSTATVTGAIDHDNNGAAVATTFAPASVAFTTTYGTLDHASAVLGSAGGAATAGLTVPVAGSGRTGDVTATLGNATVHAALNVTDALPAITVPGAGTAARSGTAITVSGTGNPGSSLQVKDNGSAAGLPVTVAGDGRWSTRVTLVDGDNALTAEQGLQVANGPTVLGVSAPGITSPTAGDEVAARTSVAGTGIAGAAIAVADEHGTAIGSGTVDAGGDYAVDLDRLAAGAHTLHVTQTTGGVTSVDATVAVTVLVIAAPAISAPAEDAVVGASLSVTGTAVANATVTVEDGAGTQLATARADGAGAFTAPITLPAIGTYALTVTAARSGIGTGPAAVVHVHFPPGAPTFDAPHGFVTGAVHLTGSALAHAAIAVYDQDGAVAAGTADGSGAYDIAVTRAAGTYHYAITQVAAGNESARSATRDVTVWPTALTITADAPIVGHGTATRLSGAAMPGATVTVSDEHGATVATATATGAGRWTASPALTDGRHALDVVQAVGAGVGEPLTGLAVTVLPAPAITSAGGTVGPTLGLAGTALASVTVVVTDEHGRELGTTTANVAGAWALTTATALEPGDHALTVHARLDGVDGPSSAPLAVTVREPVAPPTRSTDPTPSPTPTPLTAPAIPTVPTPARGVFTIARPTVKRTAITLTLRLPAPGRVVVTATIKASGRKLAFDVARATVTAAGTQRLDLTPGAKAKAALRRLTSAKVTIAATFTPRDGRATRVTVSATVRGGRR